MRAVILVIIVAVVAILVAFGTGIVGIGQGGAGPRAIYGAGVRGVEAKTGNRPGFDVETGSVKIGRAEPAMPVPKVSIEQAGSNSTVTDANSPVVGAD